jgi:hypothetical protein
LLDFFIKTKPSIDQTNAAWRDFGCFVVQADRADWYRELLSQLQAHGIRVDGFDSAPAEDDEIPF